VGRLLKEGTRALRVALVTGPAGAGKSRLVAEAVADALGDDVVLAVGSCRPGVSAPLQPVRQLVRALLEVAGCRGLPASSQGELARLVPDLFPHVPASACSDEASAYLMHEAVAHLVSTVGARHPVVVVMEDVHWGDAATLDCLRHLTWVDDRVGLALVMTLRDEPAADDRLQAFVAELHRSPAFTQVELGLLSEADLAELLEEVAGSDPCTPAAARRLHALTGGSALLSIQVLDNLTDHGIADLADPAYANVPRASEAVLRARLGELPPEDLGVVRAAAVVGSPFSTSVVTEVLGSDATAVVDALDHAEQRHLLRHDVRAGRGAFAHELLRQAVLRSLSPGERARLHLRAAEVLEGRRGPDRAGQAAAIAHHRLESAGLVGGRPTIDALLAAADAATEVRAHADATALYERALELLDDEPATRVRLLILLGRAQRRSGILGTRSAAMAAVAEAEQLGDPLLFAEAAVEIASEFSEQRADIHELHERALAALPADERRWRARLLAQLARRTTLSGHSARTLIAEALALVEGESDDVVAPVLGEAAAAAAYHCELDEERAALPTARVQLAERTGDDQLLWRALFTRAEARFVDDIDGARDDLRRLAGVIRRTPEPLGRQVLLWGEACDAVYRGELAEGAGLAAKAFEIVPNDNAAGVLAVQTFGIAWLQGTITALIPDIEGIVRSYPYEHGYVAALAMALCEADCPDDALALVRSIVDVERGLLVLPGTRTILTTPALVGEVAARSGDLELAAACLGWLEPYAGRSVMTANLGFLLGSVDRVLGVISGALGELDAAGRWFEQAVSLHRRTGGHPWVARSLVDWAEVHPDRAEARRLASDGRELAERLGMARDVDRADAVLAARPERGGAPGPVFRRAGDLWELAYRGRTAFVRDGKGMHHLAALLAVPGQEVHAIDLVVAGTGSVESGALPVLDPQAKQAYRQRLAELEAELDEAEAFGDPERATRARLEREALVEQLTSGFGLGGATRSGGSSSERARVSATRAIRAALGRIGKALPELGAHLDRSVSTGTYCSYRPDPHHVPQWRL
jgi:hypothetical protein